MEMLEEKVCAVEASTCASAGEKLDSVAGSLCASASWRGCASCRTRFYLIAISEAGVIRLSKSRF